MGRGPSVSVGGKPYGDGVGYVFVGVVCAPGHREFLDDDVGPCLDWSGDTKGSPGTYAQVIDFGVNT